ncbi:hypothetical protein [Spirulina sp. 06S082]|uniref:hypothetical protein n=1 Tax=Spirulina sp. 06S082 TaxID=3110248 RepID=UPI002B20BC55|nr:hypothetical protein [Spirulina sp. 06S082]MEA5471936.1 hypothetical protein [Spirulina sp. 06S082]
MSPTLAIQELAIAIAAPDSNPILLTPTFLKGSGIVPQDWELARQPRLTPQMAQVAFTNGINLITQAGTMTFLESLSGKNPPTDPKIPDLAQKYINALPQLDYRAAAINPRSFLTFPDAGDDAARNYIKALFAPAPWQNAGSEPMKANLNLTYTLENRKFNLTLSEVKLQRDEEDPQMAVLFSGNFPNPLEGESNGEKLEQLQQAIAQWQQNWDSYRHLLGQFLGE